MGDTGLEVKSNKVLVDSNGKNDSSGELTLEDRGAGLGECKHLGLDSIMEGSEEWEKR